MTIILTHGRIHGNIPSVCEYLFSCRIASRRRHKVYHCTRHLLFPAGIHSRFSTPQILKTQHPEAIATYVPDLPIGTGIIPFVCFSTMSGVTRSSVISDGKTPGATLQTRIGMFFNASSVASIFVR